MFRDKVFYEFFGWLFRFYFFCEKIDGKCKLKVIYLYYV